MTEKDKVLDVLNGVFPEDAKQRSPDKWPVDHEWHLIEDSSTGEMVFAPRPFPQAISRSELEDGEIYQSHSESESAHEPS